MPPNNTAINTPAAFSPNERTPSRAQTPPTQQQRPLTPLSYLSSPVPDLAATLHTQASDDADEANVSFLRESLESLDQAASQQPTARWSMVDAQRDPRREAQPPLLQSQPPQQRQQESSEDLTRRERLQRVLARLNRLHEPSAASTSAYTNRTPSPNRQSLYDWAPAYEEQQAEQGVELDRILAELRRQQPDTHPEILRVLGQSQLGDRRPSQSDAQESSDDNGGSNRSGEQLSERRRRERERINLRSRAAMQRVRQEGSPSSTDRMLRYMIERERSGLSEEEERARGTGWYRPSPQRPATNAQPSSALPTQTQASAAAASAGYSSLLPPRASEIRERDRQERVEAFRRGYLAENTPPRLPRISTPLVPPIPLDARTATPPPPPSQHQQHDRTFLENALRYLSALRHCHSYEEALSAAINNGLATKEFFADKHDQFVMDLESFPPLPDSSWLQPGSSFEGHQHANNGSGALPPGPQSSTITHHRVGSMSHIVEQINPNYRQSTSSSLSSANTTIPSFAELHHTSSTLRLPQPSDAVRPRPSHQFVPPTRHPSGMHSTPRHQTSQSQQQPVDHDQWPVRVVIHAVDREKMTLQGTMEAYDVPQHPAAALNGERARAGNKASPITTYLEGQIIDIRTNSFLTPQPGDGRTAKHLDLNRRSSRPQDPSSSPFSDAIPFPCSSSATDAANWLKLPPFSTPYSSLNYSTSAHAATAARTLLSTTSLQQLQEHYIFMRWKERCFVHHAHESYPCNPSERNGDQDRGHGLTISGFYYVALNRETGAIDGLYFDPASTPFQCLKLQGTQGRGKDGGLGAWEFR